MFTLYGGFGVGMAFTDVEIDVDPVGSLINDNSVALAGQVGSGVLFDITDNLTLDVGYRFKAALDVLTEGDSGTDSYHGQASYYSNIVQGGLTWNF
jgi:opacity protein-like surface antigen